MKKWVVGIDEVGRGPIAGPVTVCACAIQYSEYKKIKTSTLKDSKKMLPKKREFWHKKAQELVSLGILKYAVVSKGNTLIDRKGVAYAIRNALGEALEAISLNPKETKVLLDGSLSAPKEYKDQKTIIKGDQKEKIISLASVIAKVSRDKKMLLYHRKYPLYMWDKNKGYGTKAHYAALKKHKQSPLHRKSFLSKLQEENKDNKNAK